MQIFAACVLDFGIQADDEAHFHTAYSQNLGVPGGAQGGIRKVRDAKTQVSVMGVPQAHLGGHAFHTYRYAAHGPQPKPKRTLRLHCWACHQRI